MQESQPVATEVKEASEQVQVQRIIEGGENQSVEEEGGKDARGDEKQAEGEREGEKDVTRLSESKSVLTQEKA